MGPRRSFSLNERRWEFICSLNGVSCPECQVILFFFSFKKYFLDLIYPKATDTETERETFCPIYFCLTYFSNTHRSRVEPSQNQEPETAFRSDTRATRTQVLESSSAEANKQELEVGVELGLEPRNSEMAYGCSTQASQSLG